MPELSIEAVRPFLMPGEDRVVSSSAVREAVAQGDVTRAAALLGRPYAVEGVVIHGDARGRTIGFPTANLQTDAELLPAPGVYAVDVDVVGGAQGLRGVANLGVRPTFGKLGFTIEAHLLHFTGDLYGQTLSMRLLQRLRGGALRPGDVSVEQGDRLGPGGGQGGGHRAARAPGAEHHAAPVFGVEPVLFGQGAEQSLAVGVVAREPAIDVDHHVHRPGLLGGDGDVVEVGQHPLLERHGEVHADQVEGADRVGHPVRHSLSPAMHNALFGKLGLDAVYLAFDVDPRRAEGVTDEAVDPGAAADQGEGSARAAATSR